MKNNRNSSFELIKCIAIVFIVFSHGVYEPWMQTATSDNSIVMLMLLHSLGQVGNALFVACSAWFLLDDDTMVPLKVYRIIIDCFIISIIYLSIYLLSGVTLPTKYIVKSFMPVLFGNWWFIPCYIILYLLHPELNLIIKSISRETLRLYCLGYISIYTIFFFITRASGANYSNIIGFIGLYFLIAYKKKYMRTSNYEHIIMIGAYLFLFLEIVLTNLLGQHISLFSNRVHMWTDFINPTVQIIALSTIGCATKKNYNSVFINQFSGLSLYVYLIHANFLNMDVLRTWYFNGLWTSNKFVGGGCIAQDD